jgi:hypothetical protein
MLPRRPPLQLRLSLVVTDAFLDPGGVIRIGPRRCDRGRKAQAHKNCQRHKNCFHTKILPFSDVNWAGLAANAPEVTQIFGCILKPAYIGLGSGSGCTTGKPSRPRWPPSLSARARAMVVIGPSECSGFVASPRFSAGFGRHR